MSSDWSSDVCSADLLKNHLVYHRKDRGKNLHPWPYSILEWVFGRIPGEPVEFRVSYSELMNKLTAHECSHCQLYRTEVRRVGQGCVSQC